LTQLFKKAACFTDIHFGNKSNSKQFNQDANRFVDWFIGQAKEHDCETCIFLGDWHHQRAAINVDTLSYSLDNLEKLSKNFDLTYFLLGNHDLYYKETREVSSMAFARNIERIKIISHPTVINNVAFIPWLVGEEWRTIRDMNTDYTFGHFELPNFLMNAMVRMPDTAEIQREDFANQGQVFTGHFHKRQIAGNIHYLGSPFAHNYADADDFNRGMMVLEYGNDPKYINWTEGPTYKVVKFSELINNTDAVLKPQMHVRVMLDVEVTYEELNFVKEEFIKKYDLRELSIMQDPKALTEDANEGVEVQFESVDNIVLNQLATIESDSFDKELLRKLYQDL
jgi:DNA repair exonuclease SbcCD nuclease subunit